jgi:hypothetical protein
MLKSCIQNLVSNDTVNSKMWFSFDAVQSWFTSVSDEPITYTDFRVLMLHSLVGGYKQSQTLSPPSSR